VADFVTVERWNEVVAYYRRILRDPSAAESWAELHVHHDEMEREMREDPRPKPKAAPPPPKLSARAQRSEANRRAWAERYPERAPGRHILK
jgi:hypothetical protein